MTIKLIGDGVAQNFKILEAFVKDGTTVTVDDFPVMFSWINEDTLRLDFAPASGSVIKIDPNTSGVITNTGSGLTEEQLQSNLVGVGAVRGELRVFNTLTAPENWVEVDRSTPPPLVFSGTTRSLMCSARSFTANTANTTAVCVAGEHNGFVYYLYGIQSTTYTSAYLEKMDMASGKTSLVSIHPFSTFSNVAGFYIPSAIIVGDYLYAFGGKDYQNAPLAHTYRINLNNPGAGWTALQNMPVGSFSMGSPVAVGTKIYTVGGVSSGGYLSTVRVFNTEALSWSTLGSTLPFGTCENTMTATTPEGNILCVGGWSGSVEIKKFATLNLTTNTFGAAQDLPSGWTDRPRFLFRLQGQNVRGVCYTSGGSYIVEYNGSSWTDTGIAAVAYGQSIGRGEMSDGSHFMPASNCNYLFPHVKHIHAASSKTRLLCAKS